MNGWRALAACRGVDLTLFFPDRGDHCTIVAAKTCCAGCQVQQECLTFALASGERFGIWGGTSERQRRRIRRAQQQPSQSAREAVPA